jgi:hypothetical protein
MNHGGEKSPLQCGDVLWVLSSEAGPTRSAAASVLTPAVGDEDFAEHALRATTPEAHPDSYQIRCGRCQALIIHGVQDDVVRVTCPSCQHCLTLPATLLVTCPFCGAAAEYSHVLAGHSAACQVCAHPLALPAIVGRVRRPHSHHAITRYRRLRSPRGDAVWRRSGERALIILAAAIVTLLFLLVMSFG